MAETGHKCRNVKSENMPQRLTLWLCHIAVTFWVMKFTDIDNLIWLSDALQSGRTRELRLRAHQSQESLALLVGSSAAAVSLWEGGHRRPRGKRALRYARVLRQIEQLLDAGATGTTQRTPR